MIILFSFVNYQPDHIRQSWAFLTKIKRCIQVRNNWYYYLIMRWVIPASKLRRSLIDETMILNFKSTIALLVLLKKSALPRKMWCTFKVSVMFCLACLLTLIAVLISSFPIRHTYSWYASDDIVAKKPRRYRI